MNTKKSAVLKYSWYTTALTRSLKSAKRLHCMVNDEARTVYVCNGYFLVKLDRTEYNALVRPVTQREAGNYVVDANGDTDASIEPMDMEKLLADAAREAAYELTPSPFLVDPGTKATKAKIVSYYSESGDFVSCFNSDYAAIIDPSLPRKSKSPDSPMVVFYGNNPQAMILPVRLDETKSRVPAAVRAYFVCKPDDLERAHEQEISRLQNIIDAKSEQIETLTARLNAQLDSHLQDDPAVDVQQEQTPSDKAAALVETLTALYGITATIKGAQTTSPVVWLTGKSNVHKGMIEAMGGRWSGKRSAWYFKIA